MRFGKLVVVAPATSTKKGSAQWECVCDCGVVKTIQGVHLRSGATQSCSCLMKEKSKERATVHGKHGCALYWVWLGIKARCYNPNHISFASYGGRGIDVCDRWLHSFDFFLEDMGERPFLKAQIDRIDNDKGYYPENCRWATTTQNARNKRNNRIITYNGETLTAIEWSERLGIDHRKVKNFLEKTESLPNEI